MPPQTTPPQASRPLELILPEPELVLSEPEAGEVWKNNAQENTGLNILALSVTAHLRGKPGEALEHLHILPAGEDFSESLAARALLRLELQQYEQAASDFEQLPALRPHAPDGYFHSGVCYFHLSRYFQALERFTQAVQMDPDRADFLTALGTCLLQLKQPEEALAAFRKALHKSPEGNDAILGQAIALHMCYELDDAELAYRHLLARNPTSLEALTNMVILGQQTKDDAGVREHARRLLVLEPDSEPALLALSNLSFTAGAFDDAAVQCATLARLRPDQHDYWYNLGVAEERRGDLSASARAFENAASAEPSSAPAYLACGSVYEKIGDHAAARVSLERVLRLSPQQIDVKLHIAFLAERQDLMDEAISLYQSVLAEDPTHLVARFRLGYAKLERQDYQGAAQEFATCLTQRPHWREAEIDLSLAYSKLNRAEDARAVLDALLAREPDALDALRGSAAVSLASDPAGSLKKLATLHAAGDRSPEVSFNSGVLYQKAGDGQRAIVCYREALAANPHYAEALVNLGHALMATGEPAAAHENWAAAVELNPNLARGYFTGKH